MRQLCAYDANNANEFTRRLVDDGMSMEHGYRILCSVSFVRSKQFILCSALRHKSYLTVSYVTSIRDPFCL